MSGPLADPGDGGGRQGARQRQAQSRGGILAEAVSYPIARLTRSLCGRTLDGWKFRFLPNAWPSLKTLCEAGEKDTASALDEALAEYLDWERRDYEEAVEGVRAVWTT